MELNIFQSLGGWLGRLATDVYQGAFWLYQNFYIIKTASIVLSLILLFGIIYAVVGMEFINLRIERLMEAMMVGDIQKRRSLRGWRIILRRLRSKNPESWQLALDEADRILNEVLKLAGYYGKTLTERLENITAAQISNVNELRQAHYLAEKVKKEPEFLLTREMADEAIYIYRRAFQELRLID